MKTATALFLLAWFLFPPAAFAADASSSDLPLERDRDVETHHSLELETDAALFAGYRFTHLEGSREAAEYEYFEDSILFGGDLRFLRYPHRLHLDVDFRNENDYFADLWYTYKNIFFGREVNSTFFHNLPNIDLDPFQAGAGVDIRDPIEVYGIRTAIDHFLVRGKTPEFPLHVYVDGRVVRKNGDRQQRSLLGGAYFNDIVKSSQRRKIDFRTTDVTAGINSHVGPVEIAYEHGETWFEVGDDGVLYDAYDQSGFDPPPGVRPAGVYPHNLTPEVRSSVDRVEIHTSYTGKLVASGTFQRTESKNRHSGAESEYLMGVGEVTVMPMPKLAFFLEYSHKTADIDNPDTVTITDPTTPANTFTYPVRASISSSSNQVSGTARYRPLRGLTLKAGYRFRDIDRREADAWGLPDSSREHRAHVSARATIASSLQAKAEYIYRGIDDPALNIDPDSSHEGRFSLSWLPMPRLSTLVSYDLVRESRGDLHFADTEAANDRDVRRHFVLGSITYQVLDALSLTASAAYTRYRIEQDIEYHDEVGTPHVDPGVPYRTRAQSYSFDAQYVPHARITLAGGVQHTIGESSFSPNDPALLAPESISSFSKMKTKETGYSASCQLDLGKGFSSRLRYRHTKFDDDLENPYDDAFDGRAHFILLALSKEW